MDPAVGLVQAYLRVNGCFTVTEYPILHHDANGRWHEATDIDVLALRMRHAGRVLPRPGPGKAKWDTDPALDLHHGQDELIIGEVKQGDAELNVTWNRPAILYEAVRRFGLASRDEMKPLVRELLERGEARTEAGARVRLVVFGSRRGDDPHPFTFVPLSHVVGYLQDYLRAHWRVQAGTRFRDPALAQLALLEKARRA